MSTRSHRTLYETNYRKLDEIFDIADDTGANNINFHHLLFLNQAIYDEHSRIFKQELGQFTLDWAGFVWTSLPEMDPEVVIASVRDIEGKSSQQNIFVHLNYTDDEIRDYYSGFEFESTSYAYRCVSLWMTAYIMPDGAVRPYHTMNFSPGNIHDASFTEIWNNQVCRIYRRLVKRRKRFPVCAKGCTELYRY